MPRFRQRYNQRLSEHVGTATQPGSTSEVLREAARIGAWLVHLQYITCHFPGCQSRRKMDGDKLAVQTAGSAGGAGTLGWSGRRGVDSS